MRYQFFSNFAARLEEFIKQKHAVGYIYDESSRILHNFDLHCMEKFPGENVLTQEICLSWAVKKDGEGNNTFRNRMMPVREFARYLRRIGEPAYLLPPDLVKKAHPKVPYIFTEAELLALWDVLDQIKPRKGFPVRHFVIPVFFRLLYCCGLRPGEARRLRVLDVHLDKGRLDIMESKSHSSRIVMMADDMAQMMRRYDRAVSAIIPDRSIFFPTSGDRIYTKKWLEKTMHIMRLKAGIQESGEISPRPYDFRHTFATHRLYRWMKEGKDLNAMMPYLSAYMGHSQLSDTYYYIHLVPGMFEEMSGFDFSMTEHLLPEVMPDE